MRQYQKIDKLTICLILLLLTVSIESQNITTSQICTFSAMTLQSSQVIPFSIIEHLSQDKNSAYETELDENENYHLYGYKNQFQVESTVTTDVAQFNIPIDILFQITYISSKGGCVIVDNSTQLIAFQTSTLNFVQVQRINYTSYTSLRASESCNIIQIIDGTNPLNIYINSNVYSGANTPTANTLFDNTFTFGLDDSNNLYQFASDSFTIIKTFDSTINLDTPLNVIDKPDSSFVILYSTNSDEDYALVIYDYSEDSILVQQKWTAAQLTGNKVLKVQNGDRFISLMFKDDTEIPIFVFGYCEACQSPCQTCYQKKSICKSCIQGYTLKGKKCGSSKNNEVNSEIDIPLQTFILIQKTLQKLIQDTCSKVEKTTDKNVIFHKVRKGSTIIGATISASSPTAVSSMNAGLESALAAGNNVQGFTFISSTVTANGLTDSPILSNLGLILGVSIPLFIIFILLAGYIIYKKNDERLKDDSSSAIKESQNNIHQSSEEYTQKV